MERRYFLKTTGKSGLYLASGGLTLALSGCKDPIFDPSWVNAKEVPPLPDFKKWWDEISACSGLSGDFNRVHWFHVLERDIPCVIYGEEKWCFGIHEKPHNIYLSDRVFELYRHGPGTIGYENARWKVKHEELHDLLQIGLLENGDHHPLFYKCGVR